MSRSHVEFYPTKVLHCILSVDANRSEARESGADAVGFQIRVVGLEGLGFPWLGLGLRFKVLGLRVYGVLGLGFTVKV